MRIEQLRKEKHISQTALSMKLNVTQNMVSFYERGRHQPGIDTLKKLSEIFNVSVDYIIENSDVRYKAEDILKDRTTPLEAEMLSLFRELPRDGQQKAIGMIQAVLYMENGR